MSEAIKDNITKVKEKFANFTNYIELNDFRQFLLFTLTSQVPTNIMAQLGLGGNREIINLPYDPLKKIYYQKINLISAGSLIIYARNDIISENFLLEKDEPIFKDYLNQNEQSLAFRGKEKFLLPQVSDCGAIDDSKITIKIDDLFHSLQSFVSYSQPNVMFVIDAKDDNEADIIFTFNMMPQFPGKSDEKVLKIDTYLDKKHETKGITYLKREEDYSLTFLKDIKEISHSDLYKSFFSLIIHIKSFDSP
ncbi:MAG: hypothetical protein ACTSP9_12685 [Promethearchaeota archaeon]